VLLLESRKQQINLLEEIKMELKAYEVELGRKLAIAETDLIGFDHYDGGKKVIIAKKGDTVKVLQEFADHVYIQVNNWDFEVVVYPEEIKIEDTKIEEENKMQELKVGMVVKVELNYGEVVGTVTEVCEGLVNDGFYMVDEKGTNWKFFSDIHTTTILDEAIFHGMEGVEVINRHDFEYFDKAYKVSVYNYDGMFYGVYASDEQHALDIVVDWLEQEGKDGLFYDEHEIKELEEDGLSDILIVAGTHCHSLDSSHIHIRQVK
jgi:hypothetical protein